MKPTRFSPSLLLLTLLGTGSALAASSGIKSSGQSAGRPFGLEISDSAKLAENDVPPRASQPDFPPGLAALGKTRPSDRGPINDSNLLLDPDKLIQSTVADVRVDFVGQGVGNPNSLGFNTAGGGVPSGNPLLIFPEAGSPVSTDPGSSPGSVIRTSSEPLLVGDFVEQGNAAAVSRLDFFLIGNSATGGNQVISTDASVNPDGVNHVVSFAALSGSYLLIGFEDLVGGEDRDFNDALFAGDIGARNLATLTAAHEPAALAMLAAFLGIGGWVFRRRATPAGGAPPQSLRPG